MSWGDSFKSAWNAATEAARAAASAVATGVEAVADETARAIQLMAREGLAMVKAGANAAVDAAEWTVDQSSKAAKAIASAGVGAAKATAKGVGAAYNEAKKLFSAGAVVAATALCAAENWAVGGITLLAGVVLTKPAISDLLRPVLQLGGDKSQKPFDGDIIGGGCKIDNPTGVMPPGCFQKPGTLPKITYVNGINTRYTPEDPNEKDPFKEDGICKTMQEIARTTCSEVTGVYNATEGIGGT